MKIAVTGASGHVGTNLCRMLLDQGHQVKALVHQETRSLSGLQMDFVRGNITCETDLVDLCRDCDVVYHLAATISMRKRDPKCREININGCNNLLRAAKKTSVKKIIHFSSIHAFCPEPFDHELNESRELCLKSTFSYNQSKAWGQKIMSEASSEDLQVVVINPTAIIGPNDFRPSLLGIALLRFFKGQNPGLIPGGYDWVDVRDVCSAAINALQSGIGGECYLIGGGWQSLETVVHEIGKQGGHKPPRLNLPMWMARIGAPLLNLHALVSNKAPLYTAMTLDTLEQSHRNISCKKARLALQYQPRPFGETIADTIKWFQDNKYL
jgi:dihydroflavonol-4-reductase